MPKYIIHTPYNHNKQQIEIEGDTYEAGIENHVAAKRSLQFADLSHQSIYGRKLDGANLVQSHAVWCKFDKSTLHDATLSRMIAPHSVWNNIKADRLTAPEIELPHAQFINVEWNDGMFEGAQFQFAEMAGIQMRNANAYFKKLTPRQQKHRAPKVIFDGATLDNGDISGGEWQGSFFRGTSCVNLNVKGSNVSFCTFSGDLDGMDFTESIRWGTNFMGATITKKTKGVYLHETTPMVALLDQPGTMRFYMIAPPGIPPKEILRAKKFDPKTMEEEPYITLVTHNLIMPWHHVYLVQFQPRKHVNKIPSGSIGQFGVKQLQIVKVYCEPSQDIPDHLKPEEDLPLDNVNLDEEKFNGIPVNDVEAWAKESQKTLKELEIKRKSGEITDEYPLLLEMCVQLGSRDPKKIYAANRVRGHTERLVEEMASPDTAVSELATKRYNGLLKAADFYQKEKAGELPPAFQKYVDNLKR